MPLTHTILGRGGSAISSFSSALFKLLNAFIISVMQGTWLCYGVLPSTICHASHGWLSSALEGALNDPDTKIVPSRLELHQHPFSNISLLLSPDSYVSDKVIKLGTKNLFKDITSFQFLPIEW